MIDNKLSVNGLCIREILRYGPRKSRSDPPHQFGLICPGRENQVAVAECDREKICSIARQLIPEAYLMEDLNDVEREEFEHHSLLCAECATAVRIGGHLLELLRGARKIVPRRRCRNGRRIRSG